MGATRIMHVDDEPDIREVVGFCVDLDPTMTVFSYSSGSEALQAFEKLRPDLILLDAMMPVMDGPSTLARLKADHPGLDTPVVFMTARVQRRELEYFQSLGAAGILAKPFDPATLTKSLRAFVRSPAPDLSWLRESFLRGAARRSLELAACKDALRGSGEAEARRMARDLAHKLAGAAGMYGYDTISDESLRLEESLTDEVPLAEVERTIDEVRARIAKAVSSPGEPPVAGLAGAGG